MTRPANPAYIVDAVRTPVGKRGGGLAHVHPSDLAAVTLNAIVDRSGIDPAAVDDVILGCVNQMGAQAGNIARVVWLSAGLPESVPGTTVDRRCGSGQQAVDFAAQATMAGVQDLVIAGGVENMSMIPIGSPAAKGQELGMGGTFTAQGWISRYGDQPVTQFRGAELIAETHDITRQDMERYALSSHQRAVAAAAEGRFDRELVPVEGVMADEGPRPATSLEKMAALAPLQPDGRVTAAVASQISDASAMLLLASEDAVERHGLTPRARLHASAVVGTDPIMMLYGPIPATEKVLGRGGLTIEDIDLFEVNEAFASIVLAWAQVTGAPLERTNVNGGAIALGHPLGATGARLMTTLLYELERSSGRYGLQAMCEGSGTANATFLPNTERKRLAQLGYLGIALPEAYGGGGAQLTDALIVVEELAKRNQTAAFTVFEANTGPARVVELFGTEEQKQRLLPPVAAGDVTIAISISEPDAGSAATDVATTAVLDGDDYLINGMKRWCSGAGHAEQYLTYVRIGDAPGGRGVAGIVVDRDSPGLTFGPQERLHGFRGIGSADMFFDNVRVPKDNLIVGPGTQGGFKDLFTAFSIERLGNSTMSLAMAQAALDRIAAYVQERQQFGKDLIEFQSVQVALADMVVQVEAARLLIRRAAVKAGRGAPDALEASTAKCFANEMAVRVTEQAMMLHGGYGMHPDYEVERMHRDAHCWAVAGGTPAIQRTRIASTYLNRRFDQRR